MQTIRRPSATTPTRVDHHIPQATRNGAFPIKAVCACTYPIYRCGGIDNGRERPPTTTAGNTRLHSHPVNAHPLPSQELSQILSWSEYMILRAPWPTSLKSLPYTCCVVWCRIEQSG